MNETLPLFRRRERAVPNEELAQRDETIAALRHRLHYLQTALDASARERVALHAAVRELTEFRQQTEALTLVLADALREHRAALGGLEQALG